jgi:prophage antirepressor-like protein
MQKAHIITYILAIRLLHCVFCSQTHPTVFWQGFFIFIMETKLQIFKNSDFGEIRIISIDNELWFVGVDVATALGYKRPKDAVRDQVYEEDRQILQLSDYQTRGNLPQVSISSSYENRRLNTSVINESGLYTLILRSNLPSARKFQKWVTSEVLPSIRKTGSYQIEQYVNENADFHAYALQTIGCKPCITIAEFASLLSKNGIDLGRNKIMAWMRGKFMDKHNRPYQKYVAYGWLEYRRVQTEKGFVQQTVILPRGEFAIFARLAKDFKIMPQLKKNLTKYLHECVASPQRSLA